MFFREEQLQMAAVFYECLLRAKKDTTPSPERPPRPPCRPIKKRSKYINTSLATLRDSSPDAMSKTLNRKFVSFRSSSSNLDEKKGEREEYHEDKTQLRDDILAVVANEAWYQVSQASRDLCSDDCETYF